MLDRVKFDVLQPDFCERPTMKCTILGPSVGCMVRVAGREFDFLNKGTFLLMQIRISCEDFSTCVLNKCSV